MKEAPPETPKPGSKELVDMIVGSYEMEMSNGLDKLGKMQLYRD